MFYSKAADGTPFDFGGIQIRDYTSGLLDGASVAQIIVPQGAAHRKAKSTRSDKLYVGIDGTVTFSVKGKPVALEPMDLLVVEKDEWFEYWNASDNIAVLLLVHVPSFDVRKRGIPRSMNSEQWRW